METNSELIQIAETKKIIRARHAMIDNSAFEDVSAKSLKITDANLSDLEIEGAQLGGAYFHNIGMPPVGHPFYDPNAKQRPLKFEDCELTGSSISNCNLRDVRISNCNLGNLNISHCTLSGMKINGIPVEDMIKAYHMHSGSSS